MFNSEAMVNKRIKKGDRVTCTARKISEDQPIVIYRIDAIDQEVWFDEEIENRDDNSSPIPLDNRVRVLRGEIVCKLNGEIAIKCLEASRPLKMPICETGCVFNPMVGDIVDIEAEFTINRDNSSDFDIIGYYGIKANDTKEVTGQITVFKKKMR